MKIHYTRELIDKCTPIFKQGLKYIFSHSKKNTALKKHLLKTFQENLQKIPKWNSMIVMKEFDRFKINSNCSWLDKLIKAAFLAEFKIASSNSDMKVDIPKSQDFIHHCYIELARELWKKPQIMFDGFTNEIRKSYESELDSIIETTIIKVIKNLLPLEKIVNNYLKSVDEEEYNSDDDEKKSISCEDSQMNSDVDSSDYDDSDDEAENKPKEMTHMFNEDVNKVDDVMINKVGGNDENDSSQQTVDDTVNIKNEEITTTTETNDNENTIDINDISDDEKVLSNEDCLLLDGGADKLVIESTTDDVIQNDTNNIDDTQVSIEDPLVPGNIETPLPVIQDINEPVENSKIVHIGGDVSDDEEEVANVHVQVEPTITPPIQVELTTTPTTTPTQVETVIAPPVQVESTTTPTQVKAITYNPDNEGQIISTPIIKEIPNTSNEEKEDIYDTKSAITIEDMDKKILKLGYGEMEANNKKKIKNILGIDMNYYDFIKKKNRLRKSLLSKATA